jgi:hypothetical protein
MTLHGDEVDLVELPSHFNKRKLYAEYCYGRGYKVKANAKGSYGKVSEYALHENDDVLWPEGSDCLPVCSWKDFLFIWRIEFPLSTIRNPCEDTHAECHKICNSFCVLDTTTALIAAAFLSAGATHTAGSDSYVSSSRA